MPQVCLAADGRQSPLRNAASPSPTHSAVALSPARKAVAPSPEKAFDAASKLHPAAVPSPARAGAARSPVKLGMTGSPIHAAVAPTAPSPPKQPENTCVLPSGGAIWRGAGLSANAKGASLHTVARSSLPVVSLRTVVGPAAGGPAQGLQVASPRAVPSGTASASTSPIRQRRLSLTPFAAPAGSPTASPTTFRSKSPPVVAGLATRAAAAQARRPGCPVPHAKTMTLVAFQSPSKTGASAHGELASPETSG